MLCNKGVCGLADLSDLRILLAEDEALVRQGMTALLETEVAHITQVGDGAAALQIIISEEFDIALIDIGLPVRTGLDVLSEVRKRKLSVKIIMLTGDTTTYSPAQIIQAGADGFLYKTANADEFFETIISVANDEIGTNLGQTQSVAQIRDTLTPREIQVIKLVTEGRSNAQISGVLGVSTHTVRKHREHINSKLDIRSPAAMAVFAIKAKLI